MNILFLSELFFPHGSGAELATFLYARLLSRVGFKIVVVTNRFASEPEITKTGNLVVQRLPLFEKHDATKYSMLKRLDVLLTGHMRRMIKWADLVYVPRFWFSTIPLAKAYRKPVLTHLHDYIPVCPLSNMYDFSRNSDCSSRSTFCSARCIFAYERVRGRSSEETLASAALNSSLGRFLPQFVRHSDAIVCVSKTQKRIITEKDATLRHKIHVVYNPLPEYSSARTSGDDFGYFGGPSYLKGFHVLCRAMKDLRKETNVPLRIHATQFPNSEGRLLKSFGSNELLLYCKLEKDQYEHLYKKIRTVIVPSIWHEPWPYTVAEALAQGRLVIASRVGGIPEQVQGCNGAYLSEAGNTSELAESIQAVHGLKKEEAANLGAQNKSTFLRRFDNESTLKRFINLCDNLTCS